jgi:hypothetical protein
LTWLTQIETAHLHVDFSTCTLTCSCQTSQCAVLRHLINPAYKHCDHGATQERNLNSASQLFNCEHSLHHSCFPLIVINILKVYFTFLFILTLRISMAIIYLGLLTPDIWLSTAHMLCFNLYNSCMLCWCFSLPH